MLPVGIRKASITNARNTNARIKAVISHSNVFAISANLSFLAPTGLPGLLVSVLLSDINGNPAMHPCRRFLRLPYWRRNSHRCSGNNSQTTSGGSQQVGRAEKELPIMPAKPVPVNMLYLLFSPGNYLLSSHRLLESCSVAADRLENRFVPSSGLIARRCC